jgi:hypothetical protein
VRDLRRKAAMRAWHGVDYPVTALQEVAMLLTAAMTTLLSAGSFGLSDETLRIGGVTFKAQTIEVEGATVAIVDVNGDEKLDLLSAGQRLTVAIGDGSGGLRQADQTAAGEQPTDLSFADVNDDERVDIVIANHDVHYVTVLIGDGSGGFAPAEHSPISVDVDPHPHAASVVDIDRDGRADLLIDHSPRGAPDPGLRREAGGVLVRRGLGEGRFADPGTVFESGGVPYRGFAVGDIDGDGRPDVVTPHGRSVGVLLNTSEPGNVSFRRGDSVRAASPFGVELADLNGDRNLDLVVAAGEESDRVEVFLGDGRGGFAAAAGSPARLARGGKAIAVGDFNGDGHADAVVAAYRSSSVLIVLGGREVIQTVSIPGGHEHPWGVATGDLNGDGADDFVIVGDGAAQGRLYLSTQD